jgi:hypothetical protein
MRNAPWHQFCIFELHPEIAEPLVERAPRLPDVHEGVLSCRTNAIEARFVADLAKYTLVCRERDPGGPGKGAPVVEEVRDIFFVEGGVGRHCLVRNWTGHGIRLAGYHRNPARGFNLQLIKMIPTLAEKTGKKTRAGSESGYPAGKLSLSFRFSIPKKKGRSWF